MSRWRCWYVRRSKKYSVMPDGNRKGPLTARAKGGEHYDIAFLPCIALRRCRRQAEDSMSIRDGLETRSSRLSKLLSYNPINYVVIHIKTVEDEPEAALP